MRYLYIALGFLFFGLAGVGAVLPVLPTTPFLLVSSFFFIKASNRLHSWFIATKFYQRHVKSYVAHRTMTIQTKIGLLALTTLMLLIPFVLMQSTGGRIALVLLLACKYYYFVFRIKTIRHKPSPAVFEEQGKTF